MKIFSIYLPSWDSSIKDSIVCYKGDSLHRIGTPFFLPEIRGRIGCQPCFAFKMSRVGKYIASEFACRYYDAVSIGVDFTAVDLLEELQANKYPWSLAKSFEGATSVGKWIGIDELNDIKLVVSDNTDTQIIKCPHNTIQRILHQSISDLSKYYVIKIGDIIMISLNEIVIKTLKIGDKITGYMGGNEPLVNIQIK